MVECICINDKNKPTIIPNNKWIKKNEVYNIIHIGRTVGTNIITVTLKEITLTKNEYPFEGFKMERFGFDEKNLSKLFELMEDCAKLKDININELINQQTKIEEYV